MVVCLVIKLSTLKAVFCKKKFNKAKIKTLSGHNQPLPPQLPASVSGAQPDQTIDKTTKTNPSAISYVHAFIISLRQCESLGDF